MKAIALVLAVIFFVVAILYGVGILQIGTHEAGPHVKHALLFAILGALSLVWIRFQSKPTNASLR